MGITKGDWNRFQEKVPEWQEAYMDRLSREYIEILSQDRKASERFRELEERVRKDKRSPGVSIALNKGEMLSDTVSLIRCGAVSEADLEGFSEGFREDVNRMLGVLGIEEG